MGTNESAPGSVSLDWSTMTPPFGGNPSGLMDQLQVSETRFPIDGDTVLMARRWARETTHFHIVYTNIRSEKYQTQFTLDG